LTKAYALSLAPHNIRVNCVAPGVIKTKLSQALWDPNSPVADQAKAELNNYAGRLGAPPEVASLVAFLASQDASYITGETVLVTGGV
ncbi:UNVERIFIED_CONTAM: Dehydrogenase/reductase SDR family member 4, partial [Eudyptes robustus]